MGPAKFIVGIGGSAGGLRAYIALLDTLPPDTGMALVIVSHILPTATSHLANILSKRTEMKVTVASTGMSAQKNHVYVIPANSDLLMDGDNFKVVIPRAARNNQIDLFLTSLAEAREADAIGVILSGYHADGTAGCRQIKAKGGTTFAQDRSADVSDMPQSAVASGYIDFVLSPQDIAHQLQRLATR